MGFSWGLLGVSWELSGASRSTKRGLQFRLGTPLGLVCSLLAAEDGRESLLGPSLARFWCSPGPFRGCFRLRLTALNPQNCPSEFDTLFFLVAVVVAGVAVAAAVVVLVVVAADAAAAAAAAAAALVLLLVVVDDNECNQGTGGHRAASSIRLIM